MTSYGPWIQDADVTRVNEAASHTGDEWRTEYVEVDDDYGSVVDGTYVLLSLNTNNLPAGVAYTPEPSLGESKFAMQWIQDEFSPDDPIDGRSAILNMREMYRVISASPYTDGVGFYWPGGLDGPGVPDGVVGVQWEGMDEPSFLYPLYAPAEVVGLTISGHMDAEFQDSMNTDDTTHLAEGYEFVVAVIADEGFGWDSGTDPPDPAVFFDDDLIDHGDWNSLSTDGGPNLASLVGRVSGPAPEDYTDGGQSVELEVPPDLLDPMGRAVLYTQMDFATEGPLIAATGEPPDPPGITGVLGYGYHLGAMTATWTLRPRRYRWVFARGSAPPLRRRQRDDDAINNNRNRGLSSQQHSLRNSGYL